ncbi:MAG: hypothetical protein ABJB11_05130 [Ferruginibacter sp.]
MKHQFNTYDDDKIILLLNEGNKDAWEYVYDKYSMPIYGKLLRMTSSKELAEEVLVHVFMGHKKRAINLKKKATLFITLFNYTHEIALQFIESTAGATADSDMQEEFPTINKLFFNYASENIEIHKSNDKLDIGKQLRSELKHFGNSIQLLSLPLASILF